MMNKNERARTAEREISTEDTAHGGGRPPEADRASRRGAYHLTGRSGTLPLRLDDPPARDLAMLIEGETSGRPLEDVLAEFGRARSGYYLKLKRFREEGLAGLFDRPPGPRGPWKRPFEVVRFVVMARLRDPSRSADHIAAELARTGHEVSARTVQRTLEQFGLAARRAPRMPEHE